MQIGKIILNLILYRKESDRPLTRWNSAVNADWKNILDQNSAYSGELVQTN